MPILYRVARFLTTSKNGENTPNFDKIYQMSIKYNQIAVK
jgi:hypothetical protein